MNEIYREIWLTENRSIEPISVTENSKVPIKLKVMDATLTGSKASVYAYNAKSGGYTKNPTDSTVANNTVTIVPASGLFLAGNDKLQVHFPVTGGEYITNREYNVVCAPDYAEGGSTPKAEDVRGMVERAEAAAKSIPSDYGTMSVDVDGILQTLKTDSKCVIERAYISAGGQISRTESNNIVCKRVYGNKIDRLQVPSGNEVMFGFFTDRPQLLSISVDESRYYYAGNHRENIPIPDGVQWIAVRVARDEYDFDLEPKDVITDLLGNDFSVAADIDALGGTTTRNVLVLRNNSWFGDGGACIFTVRPGEYEEGYQRKDGTTVYPMASQNRPVPTTVPKRRLMGVIKSYVENPNLYYGNTKTLYNADVSPNDAGKYEIDCSSFCNAVMHEINYNHSRYVTGTAGKNTIGDYPTALVIKSSLYDGFARLNTRLLAQYFAERKCLYEIKKSENTTVIVAALQFGDILFGGWMDDTPEHAEYASRYYGIMHCMFVLGTIPDSSAVIVAQCGGATPASILTNNTDEVGKISALVINQETLNYFQCFARPVYNNATAEDEENELIMAHVIGDKFHPFFLPNSTISSTSGKMAYFANTAATPALYKVKPGSTVSFTGSKVDVDGNLMVAYIGEYDGKREFIGRKNIQDVPCVLNNRTRYVRFAFGYTQSAGFKPTMQALDNFDVSYD